MDLSSKEACYAIKQVKYTLVDGTTRNRIIFLLWCPEEAPVKQRLVIYYCKDQFRKVTADVSYEIAATDPSEIPLEYVIL